MKKNIFLTIALAFSVSSQAKPLKPIKNAFGQKVCDLKIPIVFNKGYDISFFGIEKFHSFDSKKYGRVYKYLKEKGGLRYIQFYQPGICPKEFLAKVHSQEYLDSLASSKVVAKATELFPLSYIPNFILRWRVLNPMLKAVAGTITAANLATQYGWAINLGGGYHHAKSDQGGGFCLFADIPLAALFFLEKNPNSKVMVVDLDAHQGNGHESFAPQINGLVVFDIYNNQIYPNDLKEQVNIAYNFPIQSNTGDAEYLELLEKELPKAIDDEEPGLIIYNAGTDVFEKDPLGLLSISKEGIIKRDEIVFRLALEKKIPIAMVLSGGYAKESAAIIGESIENLLFNVIKHYEQHNFL